MNSIEIRRLKNLKLTTKNIDQALKFYSIIQSKINDIFINYCKSNNIVGNIDSIEIKDDNIIVNYNYYDENEYICNSLLITKKSLL